MQTWRIPRLAICITLALLSASCATTEHRITFIQYGLEPEPSQTQVKSDVEITLNVIRPSEMYQFPELFAFRLEDFPLYNGYSGLRVMYPIGPLGKSWEHPLRKFDFSQQVLLCRVTIRNGTRHILRMKDARIYLIIEGQKPIPALRFYELLEQADYFEVQTNRYLVRGSGPLTTQIPIGFFRALLLSHKNAFNLINDLRTEIPLGSTYTGILAFPATSSTDAVATISLFDITTKVDSVGSPTEKTRFDFVLRPQQAQMWFDQQERIWKTGVAPAAP
jgi:hypothetical protein